MASWASDELAQDEAYDITLVRWRESVCFPALADNIEATVYHPVNECNPALNEKGEDRG